MAGITIHEFDSLVAAGPTVGDVGGQPELSPGLREVSPGVFDWLERQALRASEAGESMWLRLTQRRGRRAVQVTSFVGVLRAPDGFQIEVLPKLGKAVGGDDAQTRRQLIEMLRCLGGFRHIKTDSAQLVATRMPLLEIFISEFLVSVEHVVKRGLRSDYAAREDNQFTMRGKLQIANHLRNNACRRDRFFVAYDEYTTDRPENRLLRSALDRAMVWTASQANQQLARELFLLFADVPECEVPAADFPRVRLDRSMGHYADALAWAKLILSNDSPLTGSGRHRAPSLLFPMEAVFEAYVTKHLANQLAASFTLRPQAHSCALVRHLEQDWFRLKPDLLVQESSANRLVLDTKWKLLDSKRPTGSDKYGLEQGDFYQLHAYGQNYLDGKGEVVLIYPKTDAFNEALPVFDFPKSNGLRLWVLPFCLERRLLLLPRCGSLDASFVPSPLRRSNTSSAAATIP